MRLLRDRLSLSLEADYGRDLARSRRVLRSQQLEEHANWSHEAGFAFDSPASDLLTFSASGSIYDARRPQRTARDRLELGEVVRWREHQTMNGALELGLFDDRIRYESTFARSDYEGDLDRRAMRRHRRDRRALPVAKGREGEAQSHRLEADILTEGAFELSAYGFYGVTDPTYRASPGRRPGSLDYGETRKIGATVGLDPVSLDLSLLENTDRTNELQRLDGEVTYGMVSLSLSHELFTRSNEATGDWRWRERLTEAEIEVGLGDLRGAPVPDGLSARQLLPSSITLSGGRGTTRLADAQADPPDVEESLGLGLYWDWGDADTSLLAYRTVYDSNAGGGQSADANDLYVELSQGVYTERWDAALYAWYGRYASHGTGVRATDTFFGGGVSLSARPQGLPDVSTSLDVDSFDSRYPDAQEHFADRTLEFDLALDLSKYLWRSQGPDEAGLRLYYHGRRTTFSDSYFGDWSEVDHAAGLTMDFRF